MKKILILAFALILVTTGIFAGAKSEEKYSAIMGSSSLGGSWYPMASRMAGVAMKYGGVVVTVQSSGGGTENVRLMKQNQYQLGFCEPNVAIYAYEGTGPFEKEGRIDNLTYLFSLYPVPLTAVVHKNGPIESFHDFDKEKSGTTYGFSPGSPGSGDEYAWLDLFSAVYGLTKEDMNWKPLTHNERAMAFKDRILDSVGFQTAQPAGAIIELSAQNPIRILEVKGADLERALKELPYLKPYTLPAGMYNGQDEPVETIYLAGFVLANKDVPEDFIYDYMTAIFGPGLEEVQSVFPVAKELNLENAIVGNENKKIPFHPGAERFFKEKGVLK